VRVAGAAIDRVDALPVGQVDRHIGLADDDRARRLQPLHQQRILQGDLVLEARMAPGGREPGDIEALLDGHRHAEQRLVKPPGRGVHRLGCGIGGLEIRHREGIDGAIAFLDPSDRRVDRLRHAELARADCQRGGEGTRLVGELRIGHA
jgi:hypothetical protein